VLIDKALNRGYVLSPLAAPHHRREGLVFHWPSNKGKRSRPSPDGGRGKTSLPYQRSSGASHAGDTLLGELQVFRHVAADTCSAWPAVLVRAAGSARRRTRRLAVNYYCSAFTSSRIAAGMR
jgi:hypothetical protein